MTGRHEFSSGARKIASIFLYLFRLSFEAMQGKNLPILIIAAGVLLAVGAAFYMKRGNAVEAGDDNPKAGAANPSPPTGPAAAMKLGGGRVTGKESATMTLVEFGDFQCPSCGLYHPIISGLLEDSPDLVKLEFHHFPLLSIHPNALPASKAAEAAGDQGKYWEMHNLLFERQQAWSGRANPEDDFMAMAREIGLDAARFQQSYRSQEVQDRVLADVSRGNDIHVDATPTFFINGLALRPTPQTVQGFKQALLERAPAK
jgi:protein-disulfide isomerase